MRILVKIILLTIAVMVSEWLIPGVHVDSFVTGIWVAVLIAVLNAFLRPLLIFLTLPATLLTFGLFLFVINAGIILIVGDFIDGFTVDGFWCAVLFRSVLFFCHSILNE